MAGVVGAPGKTSAAMIYIAGERTSGKNEFLADR
jgi:hypothetical protein